MKKILFCWPYNSPRPTGVTQTCRAKENLAKKNFFHISPNGDPHQRQGQRQGQKQSQHQSQHQRQRQNQSQRRTMGPRQERSGMTNSK